MNKPFLRPSQVARLLGVSSTRVYQLIRDGELPATRVGGRILMPADAWARWVQEKNDRALASMDGGDSGSLAKIKRPTRRRA